MMKQAVRVSTQYASAPCKLTVYLPICSPGGGAVPA